MMIVIGGPNDVYCYISETGVATSRHRKRARVFAVRSLVTMVISSLPDGDIIWYLQNHEL